jgi:uncharacterized protein (DUF1015 family)
VIAPPYDVVDDEDVARLLARSEYNIAHVESCPGPEETRYAKAAEALRSWEQAGAIRRDERPAYYLYEQRTNVQGAERRRRCFFARMRLYPPEEGVVRPHEATMSGPRAERRQLMRATRANVSPILAVYSDHEHRTREMFEEVATSEPAFEARDDRGDGHRLWLIDDEWRIALLTEILAASNVTIADGHHRYTTALEYLDERRTETPEGAWRGDEPEHWMLAGLVADDEPGLSVLPIHRLIRDGSVPPDLIEQLGDLYAVAEVALNPGDRETALAVLQTLWSRIEGNALGPPTFGLIGFDAGHIHLLQARSVEALHAAMPVWLSDASKSVDVTVLTETVLRPLLGIDAAVLAEGERVAFVEDLEEVWDAVAGGEFRLAFLVNATRVDQVTAVADAGELMPQKTTFFYPKLGTGLVMNPFED